MGLSYTEIEERRREVKLYWTMHPVNRNRLATDALETSIIYTQDASKFHTDIERHKNQSPYLNIGYDDLIKSAAAFGNLTAIEVLWEYLSKEKREELSLHGEIWSLSLKYRHNNIAQYWLKNHTVLGHYRAHSLKSLAVWSSLNTLKLALSKFLPAPNLCASVLLSACANPRDDVMECLFQWSGPEALKKMQLGIANPEIAHAFDMPEYTEQVNVFNAFIQKKLLNEKMEPLYPKCVENKRKL